MLIYPCYFLSILIFLLDGAAKPVPSHGEVAVKTQLVLGIVDLFNQLPTDPLVVPLQTDIPFDEEGGHVQGIQLFREKGGFTAYLAGSSNDAAYLAQARLEKEAQVQTIDTLMLSPYRHAGGFQIYGQFLAVGIEDNNLRTTSQVLIYDAGNDKNWKKPIYTLERNGPHERSTAGAVGITRYKDEIIVVVADWNARNLDFYRCSAYSFERKEGHFSQIGSLEIASLQKKPWSDSLWHSYQNINLIADESGLYAMAFGRDVHENHVADLFTITMDTSAENHFISPVVTNSLNISGFKAAIHQFFPHKISLKKISSRLFNCRKGADFRAGAGIYHSGSSLILAAAPNHMDNESSVNLFVYPPDLLISASSDSYRIDD